VGCGVGDSGVWGCGLWPGIWSVEVGFVIWGVGLGVWVPRAVHGLVGHPTRDRPVPNNLFVRVGIQDSGFGSMVKGAGRAYS
jgi:hypothetical protein